MFKSNLVSYFKILDVQKFGNFGNRRVPKNDEDQFKKVLKILKILDMGSISIKKNMKWNICNMAEISFNNIKGILNLWNQETKKLWNQETKKPRNQKTRNHETCKLLK